MKKSRKKSLIKASVERLSKPKTYTEPEIHSNTPKKTAKEVEEITERLHRNNLKCRTPPNVVTNRFVDRTYNEITEIDQKLYDEAKQRKTLSTVNMSPAARPLHQFRPLTARLSTPRKIREQEVKRQVQVERECVTNEDISKLCHRLTYPSQSNSFSRARTPETKRLLNKRFSPVNTYAWQGLGYNVSPTMAMTVVM